MAAERRARQQARGNRGTRKTKQEEDGWTGRGSERLAKLVCFIPHPYGVGRVFFSRCISRWKPHERELLQVKRCSVFLLCARNPCLPGCRAVASRLALRAQSSSQDEGAPLSIFLAGFGVLISFHPLAIPATVLPQLLQWLRSCTIACVKSTSGLPLALIAGRRKSRWHNSSFSQ